METIGYLIMLVLVAEIHSKIISCDLLPSDVGWTVIQRRIEADHELSFERSWDDYVKGFGSLEGSFWLGLDLIHKLTQGGDMVLRIDLEDFAGESAVAQYSHFQIGSDWEMYRLNVSGYSGNAGDCMQNNRPFSTKDRDNIVRDNWWEKECVTEYRGAWWYDACHNSNLNGMYLGYTNRSKGITWETWRGLNYSLKTTEMKIRRKYMSSPEC